MKELLTVIAAYKKATAKAERAALACVIEITGSAYRRPGARMLVTESVDTVGSVSGGCLERDVIDHCLKAIASGQSGLLKYDTSHDDDDLLGSGNGCAGSILISVERLEPEPNTNPLLCIEDHLMPEQSNGVNEFVLVSVTHATAQLTQAISLRQVVPVGSAKHLSSSVESNIAVELEQFSNKILHSAELASFARGLTEALDQDVKSLRSTTKTLLRTYLLGDERIDFFIERIATPPRLLIFGAGHDAPALAELAHNVGMRVTVIDHRKAFADKARFPNAERVIAFRPEDPSSWPQIDCDSHCVVMSHNLLVDKVVLSKLLQHELSYLGVLGPKMRTEKIIQLLLQDGHILATNWHEQMHAPIGLDIGAETPEQIALSIIAEIQAVSARREAGFLRNRTKPIHDPSAPTTSTTVNAVDTPQGNTSAKPSSERVTRDIQCSTTLR
jgi:xanthine/CO dehydrogenase XdhC/CoxF family maturation factor